METIALGNRDLLSVASLKFKLSFGFTQLLLFLCTFSGCIVDPNARNGHFERVGDMHFARSGHTATC
jgi:hypothetical protein